jgi:hypothetical protein
MVRYLLKAGADPNHTEKNSAPILGKLSTVTLEALVEGKYDLDVLRCGVVFADGF